MRSIRLLGSASALRSIDSSARCSPLSLSWSKPSKCNNPCKKSRHNSSQRLWVRSSLMLVARGRFITILPSGIGGGCGDFLDSGMCEAVAIALVALAL